MQSARVFCPKSEANTYCLQVFRSSPSYLLSSSNSKSWWQIFFSPSAQSAGTFFPKNQLDGICMHVCMSIGGFSIRLLSIFFSQGNNNNYKEIENIFKALLDYKLKRQKVENTECWSQFVAAFFCLEKRLKTSRKWARNHWTIVTLERAFFDLSIFFESKKSLKMKQRSQKIYNGYDTPLVCNNNICQTWILKVC